MYQRILVPTDGSDTAQRGVDEAIALAKTLGARIRLVHVVNERSLVSPEVTGAAFDRYAEQLHEFGASVLKATERHVRDAGVGVDAKLIETVTAPAAEYILHEARDWPADLIVCGTHGRRGIRRIVLGSDAEYIVRQSPVPVLLVRARDGAG
ncbi:MAG TPA: universal stress protein [Steroidobacteraceae bacterium]|nr:universal stress protein [Steroidobacteraceae bacterium]